MTRIALIEIATKTILGIYPVGVAYIDFPGGRVSPPIAGWEGGGEISYEAVEVEAAPEQPIFDRETGEMIGTTPAKTRQKQRAIEGPPRFRIVGVVDAAAAPSGKRATGASYALDESGRSVSETLALEDIPPPPVVSDEKKFSNFIAASGLSEDRFLELLGERLAPSERVR